eukprot:m.97850 g.97850  ORF g.97850 m.97850 type:complete len:371 (-) comp13613_c0_seq2:2371-3483(-)
MSWREGLSSWRDNSSDWKSDVQWKTTNLSSGSTLTETAEERERRRVREREEREAREFAVLEEERRQAEEQSKRDIKLREEQDRLELERMARENMIAEERVEYRMADIQRQLRAESDASQAEKRTVEFTHELEAMNAIDKLRMEGELEEVRIARQQEAIRIIESQRSNPLGLLSGLDPNDAQATSAAEGSAPPAYDAVSQSESKGHKAVSPIDPDMPPIYSASELFKPQKTLEHESYFPSASQEIRCASCFDQIKKDASFTGRMCTQGGNTYHAECYHKKYGDLCDHCCCPLVCLPEENLSGLWGIYAGSKYHIECYQNEAGPRCQYCIDVIFENPSKSISGRWLLNEDKKIYHEECYHKFMKDVQEAQDF